MTAVFDADIQPAALKFTLLALCDNANDEGGAWPSQQSLAQKTGQARETINRQLKRLVEMGLIVDSGKRWGKKQQIVEWEVQRDVLQRITRTCDSESHVPVTEDHTEPSLEPSKEPEPPIVPLADAPDSFSEFWEKWPRKVGKDAARRAWGKLPENEQNLALQVVLTHVALYKARKTEGRYIPHASTWINNRRFTDSVTEIITEIKSLTQENSNGNSTQKPQSRNAQYLAELDRFEQSCLAAEGDSAAIQSFPHPLLGSMDETAGGHIDGGSGNGVGESPDWLDS
jgi:biotin operon repressor